MRLNPMRLNELLASPDLRRRLRQAEPALVRLRDASKHLAPLKDQAAHGMERLRPYGERLTDAVRRNPALAAGLDRISGIWMMLVDSFCATIDPYLTRWFPDLRLVAVQGEDGVLSLHRAAKSEVASVGPLAAVDEPARTALAQTSWSGIELRLPASQVLQRTLTLPAASRDFIGPIIEHRLERLTPWRPDKVLYGYKVEAEAGAPGQLGITLLATSRDIVAAPLAALGEAGLVPTAIGAAGDDLAAPLPINLIRGAAKAGRSKSRRLVSRVALTTLASLALVYVVTSSMSASATGEQEAFGRKLIKARRLLKTATIGNIGGRERAMLEAKQPDHSMVVLVDKLAAAIPETTFLKELAIAPDKVRLVGLSSDAPALVGKLENAGLSNVRFSSTITREKDGRDAFEITADRAAPAASDEP